MPFLGHHLIKRAMVPSRPKHVTRHGPTGMSMSRSKLGHAMLGPVPNLVLTKWSLAFLYIIYTHVWHPLIPVACGMWTWCLVASPD